MLNNLYLYLLNCIWVELCLLVEATCLMTLFLFIILGSILDTDLPDNILALLRNKGKSHQNLNLMPERLSVALYGHTKAVNVIQWSPTYGKSS